MKFVTYQIENEIVEFHNSILGKESIVLNGEKISEKFSFFGTEHYFKIGDNNYNIRPEIDFASPWGLGFKLHKNGLPIPIQDVSEKKNKWTAILFILASLILGFIAGYYLVTLLK